MNKIDIIITWVDGSDPKWIKERNKYCKHKIDESRYRDWELLKYWFRSIEKNIKWYNKIYFVTYGHIPNWLDTSNEKLVIVKHNEFIPQEYLPTFNSCTIELNFHRIKNLSNNFIYFNDDTFVNDIVEVEDFFKNNLPLDTKVISRIWPVGKNSTKINYNCMKVIEKHFGKIDSNNYKDEFKIKNTIKDIIAFPKKSILSYIPIHMCNSYKKNTIKEIWEKEEKELDRVCMHKFRTDGDMSQWLIQFWQIASNQYEERKANECIYYELKNDNIDNIVDDIKKQNKKFICINDNEKLYNYEIVKNKLIKTFENLYPEKSKFEK